MRPSGRSRTRRNGFGIARAATKAIAADDERADFARTCVLAVTIAGNPQPLVHSRLYFRPPLLRHNGSSPRSSGGFPARVSQQYCVLSHSSTVRRMVALVSALRPDSCVVAEVRLSPNHGERKLGGKPDMIVLHYTGMADTESAIAKLCSPASEVSAHYVVMEDGYILQCVPEARRAWHAGAAVWEGESDINSCSIGIEIANPGHSHGYPDFPKRQIAAVTAPLPQHLHASPHPGLARARPFRRRARAQAGSGREVSLADAARRRNRALGQACAGRRRAARVFVLGESDPAIAEVQGLLGQIRLRRSLNRRVRRRDPRRHRGVPAPFPSRPGGRRRRHLHDRHLKAVLAAREAQSD